MSTLKLFVHNHGTNGDQSLIKTVTFALTHFTVAFTVAYLLTGDILIGSLIAMVEPAINTVAYFFHSDQGPAQTPGPQSVQPSSGAGPILRFRLRSFRAVRKPSSITGW